MKFFLRLLTLCVILTSSLTALAEKKNLHAVTLPAHSAQTLAGDSPIRDLALDPTTNYVWLLGKTYLWQWNVADRKLSKIAFRKHFSECNSGSERIQVTEQAIIVYNDCHVVIVDPKGRQANTIVHPANASQGQTIAVEADEKRLAWFHTAGSFIFSTEDGSIQSMFKGVPFGAKDLVVYDLAEKKSWYVKDMLLFEKNFATNTDSRLLYKAEAKPVLVKRNAGKLYLATENEVILFSSKTGDLLQQIPVKNSKRLLSLSQNGEGDSYLFSDGLVEVYNKKGTMDFFFLEEGIKNLTAAEIRGPLVSLLSGGVPRLYTLQ
ncbi:MAG: hypothetical protein AB7T49_14030 [Oligoflexales bacterium]